MSPEIWVNKKLIADIPDDTGSYEALDGSQLYINTDLIDAESKKQVILLEGPAVGGWRLLGLTHEGKGNSSNPKRGGDELEPILEILLRDHPIRRSYSHKETYYNPRWKKTYCCGGEEKHQGECLRDKCPKYSLAKEKVKKSWPWTPTGFGNLHGNHGHENYLAAVRDNIDCQKMIMETRLELVRRKAK